MSSVKVIINSLTCPASVAASPLEDACINLVLLSAPVSLTLSDKVDRVALHKTHKGLIELLRVYDFSLHVHS
jgi:hypothetical protein